MSNPQPSTTSQAVTSGSTTTSVGLSTPHGGDNTVVTQTTATETRSSAIASQSTTNLPEGSSTAVSQEVAGSNVDGGGETGGGPTSGGGKVSNDQGDLAATAPAQRSADGSVPAGTGGGTLSQQVGGTGGGTFSQGEGGTGGSPGGVPLSQQSVGIGTLEEEMKRKQKEQETLRAAVAEVYLSWGDVREESAGSHRTFARYEGDLKAVIAVMKEYAYSTDENCKTIVDAVYESIAKALDVYEEEMMKWLQANDNDDPAKSHPATRNVKERLNSLHERLKVKLERYYRKALIPADQRSERSRSTARSMVSETTRSSAISRSSHGSREALARMEDAHRKTTEEFQRKLAEAQLAIQSLQQSKDAEDKLQRQMAVEKDAAAAERRELMERHMKEKQEIMERTAMIEREYGKLQQDMRLGRDRMALEQQAAIDKVEKEKRDLELDTLTKLKKMEIQQKDQERELKSRMSVLQTELERKRVEQLQQAFPAAEDLNERVKADTSEVEDQPKDEIQSTRRTNMEAAVNDIKPFIPAKQSTLNSSIVATGYADTVHIASASARKQTTTIKHSLPWTTESLPNASVPVKDPGSWTTQPHDGADAATHSKVKAMSSTQYGTRADGNDSKLLWKPAAANSTSSSTPAKCNPGGDSSFHDTEYFRGKLDGQLNERYAAMFQVGRHETDRKFSGKLEDYPMFRQELQQHYELLWKSEPRTLLKKIASSVENCVWENIKSAWVERDPWESLNMIWEILEDEYGDPSLLLNHAVRQLLTTTRGVDSNTSSLKTFRAKLRNLKAVARSINRQKELESPKLIIKILDLFTSDVKGKYELMHPDPAQWNFDGIQDFVNNQIEVSRYRERHLKDVSAVMADVEVGGSKKHNPIKSTAVKHVEESKPVSSSSSQEKLVKKPAIKKSLQSELPSCDFHPSSTTHSTKECRLFLELSPKERFKHVKKNARCYLCIGPHWRRGCPHHSSVSCDLCGKKHNTLLHIGEQKNKPTEGNPGHKRVNVGVLGTQDNHPDEIASIPIMALTAIVYEGGKVKKMVPFYAALDTGAERSLCSKNLAQKLEGWEPRQTTQLQFLDGKPKEFRCMTQPLHLKLRTSNQVIPMQEAIFLDTKLPFGESIPDTSTLQKRKSDGVVFPVITGKRRIDMIMGAPHINLFGIFFDTQWTKTAPEGPQIGLHRLGEIWWGLKKDEKSTPYIRFVKCLQTSSSPYTESHVRHQLKSLIEDDHGIDSEESSRYMPGIYEEVKKYTLDPLILESNSMEKSSSKDDEHVSQFFEQNIREVNDGTGQKRLQLPLPWKDGPVHKPESRWQAEKSLQKQHQRLEKTPEVKVKYKEKFTDMQVENHLERIPDDEINPANPTYPINYLLHFATNIATKFRIVYHCAFKIGQHSINDLLHRGPILNEPLLHILMRFRQYKYALCGDIKNMYFQILVHPKDRDMLRVVYYDEEGNIAHYRFRVMPYGLKPVSSIAGFCLQYTSKKNYADVSAEAQDTLEHSTYVDDVLDSCPTLEEARERVTEVRKMLSTTGFHAKKWLSNDPAVLKDVPEEDCDSALVRDFDSTDNDPTAHKALGIAWMTKEDNLAMRCLTSKSLQDEISGSVKNQPQGGALTQKKALSQLNSHYDPLGLWCPFFVELKRIYSMIAKQVEGWNDQVAEELVNGWMKAMRKLQDIHSLRFDRCYVDLPADSEFELHAFSDASTDFIGAAVYIRAINGGEYRCALVYGKSRIISAREIEKFSIARKELMALVLATDMVAQCKNALTMNIRRTVMWTDNTTVIKWCACTSKELLVFVRNRVDKILKESNGALPRYVDSAQNPADIATRPLTSRINEELHLWKHGAPFLWQPDDSWNHDGVTPTVTEAMDDPLVMEEIRPPERVLGIREVRAEASILKQLQDEGDAEEVESLLLLLKYCFRALKNNLLQGTEDMSKWKNDLAEREQCRLLLVKWAQDEDMHCLTQTMKKGKTYEQAYKSIPVSLRNPWMSELRKYVPYLDGDGILRMGGRMEEADLWFSHKHPAFLPRRHWVTAMYVKAKHTELLHFGKDAVFASLQQDWGLWPVGNTSTVGHFLAGCGGCRLIHQVRGSQLMSTLPKERVTPRGHVFRDVSVDYAGPFRVSQGRGSAKRYLGVFVCMSTTAVRLILIQDLTSSFFLSALRRFLARSGYVTRKIRSDNATNFVGAVNIVKEEVAAALAKIDESEELKTALTRWSIDWEFGTPEASHHNGLHERQIRTVRQILMSVPELFQRLPTTDELETCLADAEYVMNCRPLTKSPSADGLPPLRPRDLMFGALDPEDTCGPPGMSDPSDILRRGHRRSRRISEIFWERWIAEYLPNMQKRSKWLTKNRNFAVGDLVLICDEECPGYLKYPYAVITATKTDNDGLIRSVTARMSDGTLRTRDIRKIALIDAVEGR